MINYFQPDRWLIVQYRPGSGGKFLLCALQTIEAVAHWDPRVEHNEITFIEWVNQQWLHRGSDKWIAYEPLHIWDTTFFSRTYPRGNDIGLKEYQLAMDRCANPYLKEILLGNKLILDYNCKTELPIWWRDSTILTLDAPIDCPIYQNFLLNKIYPYDEKSKMGTIMLDKPLDDNRYQNAKVYNNQYVFGPFNSAAEWYSHVRNTDFRLNFNISNPTILTKDLLEYNLVEQYITQIANRLNSSFNENNLKYLHNYWLNTQPIKN
jgi:hypothetical protein